MKRNNFMESNYHTATMYGNLISTGNLDKIEQDYNKPQGLLVEQVRRFITQGGNLSEDVLLNDRRQNPNFFLEEENKLEDICHLLRIIDYIESFDLILRHSGVVESNIQEFITKARKFNNEETLRDYIHKLISLANSILKDVKPPINITYGDLIYANHLINWMRGRRKVVTLIQVKNENNKIYNIALIAFPVGELTDKQCSEFESIKTEQKPGWFSRLKKWEQQFWLSQIYRAGFLQKIKRHPQPILNRVYPGMANQWISKLLCLDPDKETQWLFELNLFRSGVIDAYENGYNKGLFKRSELRISIAEDNIRQFLLNSLPLIVNINGAGDSHKVKTSLAIPIHFQTALSDFAKPKASESKMLKIKQEAFKQINEWLMLASNGKKLNLAGRELAIRFIFIDSNYPQDTYGKLVGSRPSDKERSKVILSIFESVKHYLEMFKDFIEAEQGRDDHLKLFLESINNLIEKLKELSRVQQISKSKKEIDDIGSKLLAIKNNFPQRVLISDYFHHNFKLLIFQLLRYLNIQLLKTIGNDDYLQLAATELNIIRSLNGLAYLTCKSGKDRTALVNILADSEYLYETLKGQLPPRERRNDLYITIFSTIFFSGHHQLLASANAIGTIGIKSVKNVLPKALLAVFSEDYSSEIDKSDYLATLNNEFDKSIKRMPDHLSINRSILQKFSVSTLTDSDKKHIESLEQLNAPTQESSNRGVREFLSNAWSRRGSRAASFGGTPTSTSAGGSPTFTRRQSVSFSDALSENAWSRVGSGAPSRGESPPFTRRQSVSEAPNSVESTYPAAAAAAKVASSRTDQETTRGVGPQLKSTSIGSSSVAPRTNVLPSSSAEDKQLEFQLMRNKLRSTTPFTTDDKNSRGNNDALREIFRDLTQLDEHSLNALPSRARQDRSGGTRPLPKNAIIK